MSLPAGGGPHRLQVRLPTQTRFNPSARASQEMNRARVAFRYGVEPPVLVKLEKEIELEESLMLTEEPPPVVKTFSVCCQHGGLYQSGVSSDLSGKLFFF